MRAGADERACRDFRGGIALEPDLADNYDQLGALYTRLGKDEDAETSFREALSRDSKMASAYAGLAKIYQKQQKLETALNMIDEALHLAPDVTGGHFLRGRILAQLERENRGK